MDIVINLIIALPSVAMLIFMWLWILSKQKSVSDQRSRADYVDKLKRKHANELDEQSNQFVKIVENIKRESISNYNTLLEILDDTDAEYAADVAFLKANTTDIFMELQASQMQFFGALGEIDELKAELEKANNGIRKRCPHCNTFMTRDGECRNKKCGGKKILNATEAAKIIEEGGCVAHNDGKNERYYSLSSKRDGSIGCYQISVMPHDGWVFSNTQGFIGFFHEPKFIQVYPDVLKDKENHVEVKKVENPILDTPEPETKPNPILANAEVGDKVRLRNGDVETIFFYASERAFPIIGNTCSWQLNGRFFHVGESEYDVVELIKKGDNK